MVLSYEILFEKERNREREREREKEKEKKICYRGSFAKKVNL